VTASLSESAQRVQDALRDRAFGHLQVMEMDQSTRTAADAAAALGCTVAQIAKSLVFRGRHSQQPLLVIASGVNRVDERRLGDLWGEPVERPDADFVRQHTGFAIGGVPPISHAEPLQTFIDVDLLTYDTIWAAAGTPRAVFRLSPQDLVAMTGGKVVDVKRKT
jgi:prolyl-tRNA editing enzyme YbaK/EbsC (Cys-tRNA(Pro) deacylase)